MAQPITKSIKRKACSMYVKNRSARKTGRELGISRHSVLAAVRSAGITTYSRADARRTHQVDLHFFDLIDTEAKAYWLGFIAADGCISEGKIAVELKDIDEQHLRKLAKTLKTTAPVNPVTHYDPVRFSSRLEICSIDLVLALRFHGILSRKSLNLKPSTVPNDLVRHYWRGVIDGDGWISPGSRADGWQVGASGSLAMMIAFTAFAHRVCQTEAQPSHHGSIWTMKVGGLAMPRRLVAELYGSCTVALSRKLKLARVLMGLSDRRQNQCRG